MENDQSNNSSKTGKESKKHTGNVLGGLILITLGVLFLAEKFIPEFEFSDYWPVLLIISGVYVLYTGITRKQL